MLVLRLDEYAIPLVLLKGIKTMKINECCEIYTSNITKLHTNFYSDLINQYEAFKEGDKASFVLTLISVYNDPYFY